MTPLPIPLIDMRHGHVPTVPARNAGEFLAPTGLLQDQSGRALRDLRISVTDRCNFRCSYCMPREVFDKNYAFLPQSALLSFEEITRLAKVFVAHGVQKIRLTGGEPLLRKNLERLIESLACLKTASGQALDLTLTTNGSLLAQKAQALKDAGLQRVTVSLDALDDAVFRRMNDVDFAVAEVLHGLETAQRVGLDNIKINMVVKRGTNDSQILPMAAHFRHSGLVLRFIEYMDVGSTNGWRMEEVLPSAQVLAQLRSCYGMTALPANTPGETAERWRYDDGAGEIGLISSVTQAFCGDCTRARLSTEGQLFLCLFASQGHDLRALLRAGHSDEAVAAALGPLWQTRTDRYSQLRAQQGPGLPGSAPRVEMSYIGG